MRTTKPLTDDTVALYAILGGLSFSLMVVVLAAFSEHIGGQFGTSALGLGGAAVTGGLGLAKGSRNSEEPEADTSAPPASSAPLETPGEPVTFIDAIPPELYGMGLDDPDAEEPEELRQLRDDLTDIADDRGGGATPS